VRLRIVPLRPLHARVAKTNLGSIRVLEKCGFRVTGEDRWTNDQGEEIEDLVLELGTDAAADTPA
jgi:RimJ/RimL family protein N-acetyltransferase